MSLSKDLENLVGSPEISKCLLEHNITTIEQFCAVKDFSTIISYKEYPFLVRWCQALQQEQRTKSKNALNKLEKRIASLQNNVHSTDNPYVIKFNS